MANQPVSVVIVAGGRSRRMGRDKRQLRLWGNDQPNLLERTVQLAQQFSDDVLAVLNDPEAWQYLNVHMLPDRYPDTGALGGMATGLAVARHDWSLVLASDMPMLNRDFLQTLLDLPRHTQAIVPCLDPQTTRNHAGWQPLCALYHRSCLNAFQTALNHNQLAISAALNQLDVTPFHVPAECQQALLNVNTVEDVARVNGKQ
ncbi:MAG: molybdenum cofactor guanylyltransferase [Herpetosiphon sp.]|nr:molybdenum cofactor guanylyltransferase [Herpetosiphon sp.]